MAGNDVAHDGRAFYVYVYRDPRPGKDLCPIYVGKGTGRRSRRHWRTQAGNPLLLNVIAKIRAAGLQPAVEIVAPGLSESAAFALECELIERYGRRSLKTGTLCNLTPGGEGAAGIPMSAEKKRRIAEGVRKMFADPERRAAFVKTLTEIGLEPEERARRSARSRARANNPEYRAQRRADMLAVWSDPEYKAATTEAIRAALARPEVQEARSRGNEEFWSDPERAAARIAKLTASLIERWTDPEFRERQSQGLKRALAKKKEAGGMSPEEFERRSAALKEAFARRRAERDALGLPFKDPLPPRVYTEEERRKIGAASAAWMAGPENRARNGQAVSEAYARIRRDPERSAQLKAAKSAAAKLMWAKRKAAEQKASKGGD